MAKYIYGIINSDDKKNFGNIGMDNGETYSVQFEDICAVVSDVFEDCRIGVEEARIHDKVLRKIMDPYSVIPMGFGSIAKNDAEIKNILKRGKMKLKNTLEKVDNKLQIDIKISWDKTILAIILKENTKIQELINAAKENTDQSSRIELGRKVKSALDEKKAKYLAHIENSLKSFSMDFEENKNVDQDTILNAAFLIDKNQEQEFYAKLTDLEKKYDGKLKFLSVGPLPAYNFTKIVVGRIDYEALEEARRTLGLSQEVSISEINSAYSSLARKYHPDLHPNDPSSEKKFKKIIEAKSLMERYCEHYLCSIEKTKVEENIIVEEKTS